MFDTKDTLKKKQNIGAGQVLGQENTNQIAENEIHQMPEKFLPKKIGRRRASSSTGNNKKKVLLIVIILILFLSALISGGLIFLKRSKEALGPLNDIKNAIESGEVAFIEENTSSTEEIVEEEPVETEEEEIVEEEPVETEEEEIVEEEIIDIDADGDTLTLLEEALFDTDPNDDDSDKDGYKDASELLSLYNPLAPSQSLLDSGLVTIYKNHDYSYEIFMPSKWVSMSLSADKSKIKFLTDGYTGEFILVEANKNDTNWDIEEYKIGLNEQGLQNYNINGIPALLSQDTLTVYTINENFLYKIQYDQNNNKERNFSNVFSMMLNSFVMIEQVATIDNSSDDEFPGGSESEGGNSGLIVQ